MKKEVNLINKYEKVIAKKKWLTKPEVLMQFKVSHGEYVMKLGNDRIAIWETWNIYIDYLVKDGHISDKQVYRWSNPYNRFIRKMRFTENEKNNQMESGIFE